MGASIRQGADGETSYIYLEVITAISLQSYKNKQTNKQTKNRETPEISSTGFPVSD